MKKPALKTEQSAVLLNRAFRQKAFRMPESAEGGLLAVFCVLVSESSVIMDTRPCKAGIPDAATKQSFAVHLVWLTVLHRAGSDNCRQTCGQLKLCPAAAWEGERQSLTSQARPDKLQSSCTVMKYYKEANSETDCEYQP